jgi:chorismate dehydratase
MSHDSAILRIGQIDYANCYPIFRSLINSNPENNYTFVKGVPSELNSLLSSGQLDICPSSSIEYARHPDKYLILRDLSISSIGRVKSVFMFSRFPIENLNGKTVGLTGESATSVNLLKITLGEFYKFHNSYVKIENASIDALDDFAAILLIGDTALKAGLNVIEDVYVYDLGEIWLKNTGLPFVFALWIIREEAVQRAKMEVISLYSRLCHAKQQAYGSFENYAEDFGMDWIGKNELINYWKTISYDLTTSHIEGLQLFYHLSTNLGLVEKEPLIRIFPENSK